MCQTRGWMRSEPLSIEAPWAGVNDFNNDFGTIEEVDAFLAAQVGIYKSSIAFLSATLNQHQKKWLHKIFNKNGFHAVGTGRNRNHGNDVTVYICAFPYVKPKPRKLRKKRTFASK